MKTSGLLLGLSLVLISACARTPATASVSPTAQATQTATSPSPGVSPSAATLSAWSATSSYGLIQWVNAFGMIDTGGKVVGSVPIAPASVTQCYGGQAPANLEPPIGATRDAIYFRDGDTKIRSVAPSGSVIDVITVPGGAHVISFFSVSPDDQRIAVMTEDLSGATAQLSLSVQDLNGGGNKVQLGASSASQPGGTTIWPMGWHGGNLVVAMVPICLSGAPTFSPSEFRLVDVTTGQQLADLSGPCTLSNWPSPVGVTCVNPGTTAARIIDWTGQAVTVSSENNAGLSGLSTSGDKFFVANADPASAVYATWIVRRTSGTSTPVNEHAACLWIDNDHLLAPDAVIEATIGDMGFPTGKVSPIAQRGACAGRFPGGL